MIRRSVFALFLVAASATLTLAQVPWQPQDLPDSPHWWRQHEAQRRTEALQRQLAAKDLADPTPEQLLYDVLSYDLDLDVSVDEHVVSGTTIVRARVLDQPLSQLVLDYLGSGENAVDGVLSGGVAVAYELSVEHLTITLDRVYAPGEVLEVAVTHRGDPTQVGNAMGWSVAAGQTLIWTLSEPYGARQWWPCKDYPLDKADTVDIRVTVDDPYVVASNGLLVDQQASGGRTTYHWHSSHPIASYLVSVTAYPYTTFTDTYTALDGVTTMPVQNFVVPSYLDEAQAGYGVTPDIIHAYAQAYGEYPFLDEKYGHAGFTWGGGMEHQTCSSMIYWTFPEGLTAHELAHQWWGDLVTCASFHHIWLNEGFATWSEAYWLEQSQGESAYRESLADNRFTGDGTIYVEDPTSFSTIFDLNLSYNKASWVVHMLRGILGDDDFFAGLALYRERFAYDAAVTEDLQAAMEDVSGRDLEHFFQRWIYGEGYPRYRFAHQISSHGDGTRIAVRLEQIQTHDVFQMPVRLRIIRSDGSHEDRVVENTHRDQNFLLDGPADAVLVQCDPDEWILRDLYVGEITDTPVATAAPSLTAYPNPFNPSTQVTFSLPADGPVRLTIHDARGRLVRSLVADRRSAGDHTVIWRGRDDAGHPVAAGTYFARLVAGNESRVRALALVK